MSHIYCKYLKLLLKLCSLHSRIFSCSYFSGANAIIVIVAAIIAAIYIYYDVNELTITGDIKAGLPPFQLPNFSLTYQSSNQTVHHDFGEVLSVSLQYLTSRKHLRTKVTSDFHLTYSKNGEIWGWNQNDKK